MPAARRSPRSIRSAPPRLRREVTASVDAAAALWPVLGELFDGIDALGSQPRKIVNLLRPHVRPGQLVLDLACGKGAVAIALARALRCRVVGIDACDAFIDAACAHAEALGVADRCDWRVGDVARLSRAIPRELHAPAHAAMMLGLWPADRAARLLRRHVAPDGVYAVDDAVRVPHPRADDRSLAAIPTRAQARRAIERTGDRVLRELLVPRREVDAVNRRLHRVLHLNAARLARRRPALAPALRAFLDRQRDANATLLGPVRPIIWLVRRA